MTTKGIVFDMDGTLADTEEIHRLAFNAAFAEYTLDWRWSFETYKDLLKISGGRERIIYYIDTLPEATEFENKRDFARQLHKRKSEIYRELLVSENIKCRTGVMRLVDEAKSYGIKLAIATSSSKANVETVITNAVGSNGLDFFDTVISSDVVEDKKPCPIVYQMALSGLGLEHDECVAFEDTTNGSAAAQHASLKTIITTHEYTTDNDFLDAALVVDSLGEPNKPFNVQYGETFGKHYVDIELIEAIMDCSNFSGMDTELKVAAGK